VSGYVFAALAGAHVVMNRVVPLVVEGDSSNIGLAYVSHGFARHGPLAWVYYISLLGIGCGHIVWGWAKWLGFSQKAAWNGGKLSNGTVDKATRRRRRRVWLAIHGAAIALAAVWAAGGLGVVARGGASDGWVGRVYDGLYEKVWV